MDLPYIEQLKSTPFWLLLLSLSGFLYLLKFSIASFNWVFVTFIRPQKNLQNYGSWALITGPTDGIGKAFAFQLAREGLNLILVGRNPDKLKSVTDAIHTESVGIQIKNVVVDFSGDLEDGIQRIHEAIDGLDVGVLINNVGISYIHAMFVHEVDEDRVRNLIKINVEGTTKVTKAVLPGMLKRKKGAIINMGSGAGIIIPSHPLFAIYAATKAYIDQFSRSLYVEYKKMGIHVQCQIPLYVATKMVYTKRSSFFIPSTETYARAAIRWMGYEPRCTPYWPHSLQWCLAFIIPAVALDAWRLQFGISVRRKMKDYMKNKQLHVH